MKKFGRKTTLNLRCGSDKGSHSVVSGWKGYDLMEIVEKKETNADRIRNMSDEELACVIEKIKMCGGLIRTETTSAECNGCKDGYCCNVMQWLQSEVE